jgi:hypothetical protein
MSDTDTEGLSGTEIKNDVLAQVERQLNRSCDLRDTDCYESYSGMIEIHLKLYAVDTVSLDMTAVIAPNAEPPVSTETTIVTPVEVVEKVEIPQELNLDVVRDRSKLPDFGPVEPANDEDNPRMPARLKRKYTRQVPLSVTPSQGETVDLDEAEPKF